MTDAHCHLQYLSDIGSEVQRCKAAGITRLICAGYDLESSKKAIEINKQFPQVFATVGSHPDAKDFDREILLKLAKHPKVVAIGECGLDSDDTRELELLSLHVALAKETNLPLIIHNRHQDQKVLEILGNYPKVMLHCFTGDENFMQTCVGRGWYISFGGILTFKKSDELRAIAKLVPEDRLLVETDSPYLAPEPHRGSQNQPKNVKIIAQLLAKLRGTSINRIEEITDRNAEILFNIPHPA